VYYIFFYSSRRRHTRSKRDWSSDVCSSDLFLLPKSLCFWENRIFYARDLLQNTQHLTAITKLVVIPNVKHTMVAIYDGGFSINQIGRASCRERVLVVESSI